MKLYRVTTTFLGADAPSKLYFDTELKAKKFLGISPQRVCNGEIETVNLVADYPLNYSDGCTMDDLTYGDFNAKEVDCHPVLYEAGESRYLIRDGEYVGVDYMLVNIDDVQLYAEMENPTWDDEKEEYGDGSATFEDLKDEILSQAEENGIDPDRLCFD